MNRVWLFCLLLVVGDLWAGASDSHPDQGTAFEHCLSDASGAAAAFTASAGGLHSGSALPCAFVDGGATDRYECKFQPLYDGANNGAPRSCDCYSASGNCGLPNYTGFHNFTGIATCDEVEPIGPLGSPPWGLSDVGTDYCLGGCQFQIQNYCGASGASFCFLSAYPTGEVCGEGVSEGPGEVPEGCNVDGAGTLTCDCVASPGSWYCTNYPDPDGTETPDSCSGSRCVDDGNAQGGDDPNPDPDPGGTGCTDANSDGIDDVTGAACASGGGGAGDGDCNPLSNASCAYTGSASAVSDCSPANVPQCDGDPVQCALLLQQWHNQCFPFVDTNPEQELPNVEEQGDVGWLVEQLPSDVHDLSNMTALDDSGYLGGGSCPIWPGVTTSVGAFSIDSQPFCDVLVMVGYFIMVSAGIASVRIMAGARIFS